MEVPPKRLRKIRRRPQDILIALRVRLNLSPADVAKACGLARSTIWKAEEHGRVDLETAAAIEFWSKEQVATPDFDPEERETYVILASSWAKRRH